MFMLPHSGSDQTRPKEGSLMAKLKVFLSHAAFFLSSWSSSFLDHQVREFLIKLCRFFGSLWKHTTWDSLCHLTEVTPLVWMFSHGAFFVMRAWADDGGLCAILSYYPISERIDKSITFWGSRLNHQEHSIFF